MSSWGLRGKRRSKVPLRVFSVGDIVAYAELNGWGLGQVARLDSDNAAILHFGALARGVEYHILCSAEYLRTRMELVSSGHHGQRRDWLLSLHPELGEVNSPARLQELQTELVKTAQQVH